MVCKTSLLVLLLALSSVCFGQDTFGLQVGQVSQSRQGSALCDSIAVAELRGGGNIMIGAFYSRQLGRNLLLRSEVNYSGNLIGALVYNNVDDCLLCPVVKAGGTSYGTFEVPFTVNLKIPLGKMLSIGALGGVGFNINLRRNNPDISFRGRHPGVADVMNVLDRTPRTFVTDYIYGLRMDIWRITLIAISKQFIPFGDAEHPGLGSRVCVQDIGIGDTFFDFV